MRHRPRSHSSLVISLFVAVILLLNLLFEVSLPRPAGAQEPPDKTSDVAGQKNAAAPLFQDTQPRSDYSPPATATSFFARSRPVTVDFSQLTPTPAEHLTLNLFDDTLLTATLERIQINEGRGYTWIGRVDGNPYSLVILTVAGNLVVGEILTGPDLYRINYIAGNTHAIQQIDQSALLPDGPPPSLDGTAQVDSAAPLQQTADDGSTIDVLVVYTETARIDAGGTTAMEALIDSFIAYANQSYLNSNINQQLVLAHSQEIVYTEGNPLASDLGRLQLYDEYMDDVHSLRNLHHADMVALVLGILHDYCGVAWQMFDPSLSFAASSFSVMHWACGGRTFAHELGHNMGAHHDRYVTTYPGAYDYSNGYVYLPDHWRTIMAYYTECYDNGIDCSALPYWSNPNVEYNGVPMGVPEGDPLSADNSKTLNNTAVYVANFRDSTAEIGTITGTVTAETTTAPLAGITVRAMPTDEGDWTSATYTDNSGRYDLAIPAGDIYKVQFTDYSGGYVTEYYKNKLYLTEAEGIPVPSTVPAAGIDAALAPAGHITGTVTSESEGAPLQWVSAAAHRFDGSDWRFLRRDMTYAAGQYDIADLPEGTYRVRFVDTSDTSYTTEFYDNAQDLSSADDIIVQPGETVTNINAVLLNPRIIWGTVSANDTGSPLIDVHVNAYRQDDADGKWSFFSRAYTEENGHFALDDLPFGNYRLKFWEPTGSYATQFYENALDIDHAHDILIAADSNPSPILMGMTAAGHITGTITAEHNGAPISNIITATAFHYNEASGNWIYASYGDTDNDGQYAIDHLPAATYRIEFKAYEYGLDFYQAEYYDNVSTVDDATDIAVTAGSTVSGIDAQIASNHPLQCISLPAGWSMISSNLNPYDWYIAHVLYGIEEDMVLIKDSAGRVYWPAQDINDIENWLFTQGYQIYMQTPATLCLAGHALNPSFDILLPQGWSLIAYLPAEPMPVEQALSSISSEHYLLLKDGSGAVYWPAYGINQIGDMQPGSGYALYLDTAATLTYPAAEP